MKTKLHFGLLILLLAFFGRYLEQSIEPNQQIVIQFSDEDISEEAAESTIEAINERLQGIGAEHIQIGQSEKGQLKITYYSNTEVEHIQNILSKDESFKFTYSSDRQSSTDFPIDKTGRDYELNISEIQNNSDINWDFERTEVVELNQKSEHSYNTKVNTSGKQLTTEHNNSIVKVALKVNKTVTIVTDDRSYIIPEVRAGPPNKEFII